MRKILMAAACALPMSVLADEPKKPDAPPAAEKKPAPAQPRPVAQKREVTLKVGDAAPKFSADKWLQGSEVKSFEAGKVYVVEFWATWCGPCIVMMPHLGELQAEFKDKGVTMIGYSAFDPNNTEEKVTEFVKKRGPKLGYTFAFGKDKAVYGEWMGAAGQNGIPCCFVVDTAGKIAYIGHPMFLDHVLPKVVAKTWTAEDAKGIDAVDKDIDACFAAMRKSPEEFLKAFDELNAKYPWAKNVPYFVMPHISKLAEAKKFDDACVAVKNAMNKAVAREDTMMLRQLAMLARNPQMSGNADLVALAVKAAEANLKAAGEGDFSAISVMMDTYSAVGNKARANEYKAKAFAAAKTSMEGVSLLRMPIVKEDKELAAKVLAKVEATIATEKDPSYSVFLAVADAYFTAGDKAKAKSYGDKALAAAKTPQIKQFVERQIAKYSDEKKDN